GQRRADRGPIEQLLRVHRDPARRLEIERAGIDDRPARDPCAAQGPRRRAEVLRIPRPAEDEADAAQSPEAIFHSPLTRTKRIRASSLSLFHFSPVSPAIAYRSTWK